LSVLIYNKSITTQEYSSSRLIKFHFRYYTEKGAFYSSLDGELRLNHMLNLSTTAQDTKICVAGQYTKLNKHVQFQQHINW